MPTWIERTEETPLPFDNLPLVERLEAYDSKAYLMSYIRLDTAGVNATAVKDKVLINFPYSSWDKEWEAWKQAVCAVTGKSWPEAAKLIYGSFFS